MLSPNARYPASLRCVPMCSIKSDTRYSFTDLVVSGYCLTHKPQENPHSGTPVSPLSHGIRTSAAVSLYRGAASASASCHSRESSISMFYALESASGLGKTEGMVPAM